MSERRPYSFGNRPLLNKVETEVERVPNHLAGRLERTGGKEEILIISQAVSATKEDRGSL